MCVLFTISSYECVTFVKTNTLQNGVCVFTKLSVSLSLSVCFLLRNMSKDGQLPRRLAPKDLRSWGVSLTDMAVRIWKFTVPTRAYSPTQGTPTPTPIIYSKSLLTFYL